MMVINIILYYNMVIIWFDLQRRLRSGEDSEGLGWGFREARLVADSEKDSEKRQTRRDRIS
jgi:hypothetical protein